MQPVDVRRPCGIGLVLVGKWIGDGFGEVLA
jgi:hypothetical protein